ncbi:UDP-3-O-(3-hydroxymyristoyl) glucosamine N-acyltransferase [Thalassotalea sp. HSM 43]|uniref:DapH/DapD/GlmU-related protein n=1 Tax=Thalassotalea sp. HSM 43 TaxID=2552945 RepID=UPI001080DD9A|nr:DapH/DapD/GlmU-related protein [Thalassotalea sp. HSM 43]QBY03136.1 UDP-3-O-(3-hydroxymyristoyl) glucosamine N-acyltransferase [Thalassotalea sp. HSM 43]
MTDFKMKDAFQPQTFTLSNILNALQDLNIHFEVSNKEDTQLRSLAFKSLMNVDKSGIYFVENVSYLSKFDDYDFNGSTFITNAAVELEHVTSIVVSSPQAVYYQLMNELVATQSDYGIHPTAIISKEAVIHPQSYIGPFCVIGHAIIEKDVRLESHVVVNDKAYIGERVVIESHSTIGATGVAWVRDPITNEKIRQPQIGGVIIENDCFLGSDISVVRGSVNENTTIGRYSVIAHGSKIGHGVSIGVNVHFANNVSIAGNAVIGDDAFLGSSAVVRPKAFIAEGTVVGAGAVVTKDIRETHCVVSGVPARKVDRKTVLSGVPR